MNLPIMVMVVGCVAKLAVNYFVVHAIGITGAPIGTLACYVLIALLELGLIKRVVPASPNYGRVFVKPLISAAVMGGAVWAVHGLTAGLLGNSISTLLSIGVGGCVYAVLVVVLRAISKEDLSLMPKGDRIAKILRL